MDIIHGSLLKLSWKSSDHILHTLPIAWVSDLLGVEIVKRIPDYSALAFLHFPSPVGYVRIRNLLQVKRARLPTLASIWSLCCSWLIFIHFEGWLFALGFDPPMLVALVRMRLIGGPIVHPFQLHHSSVFFVLHMFPLPLKILPIHDLLHFHFLLSLLHLSFIGVLQHIPLLDKLMLSLMGFG